MLCSKIHLTKNSMLSWASNTALPFQQKRILCCVVYWKQINDFVTMFSLLFYSNDFFKCLICGNNFLNITKFIAYIANINYVSLFHVIQFTILEAFENYTVSIRINLTSGETQNKPRVYFWGLLWVCFFFNLPLWVLLYLTI